ncbi:MAG: hypothetical protein HY303_19430 [Candidatus Wallbacteria bacterium]|nr:hypothetical protein [Candidatus Wallbacteria bacterium]
MDVTSANRLIAVGFFFATAIALAFAFFSMTGGFRQIALPGSTLKFADDMTTAPRRPVGPPAPEVRRAPSFSSNEPFRPSSPAEKAVFAALEKAQQLDARIEGRRRERDELLQFLTSEAGKDFQTAMLAARAGKPEEAKGLLEKVTGAISEQPVRVRLFVLKSAIQVFQQTKDRPGLKGVLKRYLSILEEELSRTDLDPREKATASEMLDKVQEEMKAVDSEG